MDARLWHLSCLREQPQPPSPVKPRDVDNPATREKYANKVYSYLLQAPPVSPIHNEVLQGLRAATGDVLAQPRGARTIVALTAPFAAGKSTVAREWASTLHKNWCEGLTPVERPRWQPQHLEDGHADYVPVVYLNLQSDTKSKDLYAQLLSYLQRRSTGTQGKLAVDVVRAFADHGVRLLILDDAHMLRTHRTQGRATLDAIKTTATQLGELGGMLSLVGAWFSADNRDLLEDPQIESRLDLHEFSTYHATTRSERATWQRYMANWEASLRCYLPDLPEGTLTSTWAGRIYTRTQGYAGDTAMLLCGASRNAILQGRTRLLAGDLDSVRLSQRAQDAIRSTQTSPRRVGRPAQGSSHVG